MRAALLRESAPVRSRDAEPCRERVEHVGLSRGLVGAQAQPGERGGRHDPVRLGADPHRRNRPAPADVAREERAHRELRALVEQRLQQRPRHVAERRRPERRLHRPGLELVAALGARHLQEGARVDAEPLGEPLPVALEEPVQLQVKRGTGANGSTKLASGSSTRLTPDGDLSVLFVGVPCRTSARPACPCWWCSSRVSSSAFVSLASVLSRRPTTSSRSSPARVASSSGTRKPSPSCTARSKSTSQRSSSGTISSPFSSCSWPAAAAEGSGPTTSRGGSGAPSCSSTRVPFA